MVKVATYVFIDLETTGLPREELNKTRITELSMVAVKRQHVLNTKPGTSPRVQHKLTLCFNPLRIVQPGSTEVTGLCNDLLEFETEFNIHVFNMINTFLSVLQKPVCLVAQNGIAFDYPIFKAHVEKLNMSLSEDILCADCYHAFYDILEKKRKQIVKNEDDDLEVNKSNLLLVNNTINMQSVNETTPKQQIMNNRNTPKKEVKCNKINKARRRFPWSQGEKPKSKYKLKDIYERLLNRPALDAHRAENDCLLALECSVAIAEDFVKWIDENNCLFTEIKPMTVGVPIGQ